MIQLILAIALGIYLYKVLNEVIEAAFEFIGAVFKLVYEAFKKYPGISYVSSCFLFCAVVWFIY